MTAQPSQLNLLTGFVHFDHIRTQDTEIKWADLREGAMATVMSRYLHNDLSQARVAQQQPAAWGDAVCFVLELFWGQFMEIFKPAERKRFHARPGGDLLLTGSCTHTLFFTMSEWI